MIKKPVDIKKVFKEYCEIMGIDPTERDEIIFTAGYTFALIEHTEFAMEVEDE